MKQYLDLLSYILKVGKRKKNRTGIDTISTFGYQNRYDLSKSFPLLTTKKMFYRGIFHELIWFLRGDTNIKYLLDNNVNIWNGNAYDYFKKSKNFDGSSYEEFIAKLKTDPKYAKKNGDIGPVYGRQWRNFNGIDQITDLINQIKANPNSRRLIVSAWNPTEIGSMALPPCHTMFQFYVDTDKKEISCQLYQRSADAFLGVPFNIASYALLIYIVGAITGYKPKEFIHTFGDLHIYTNHLDQVKTQLKRKPYPCPKLIFKRKITSIDDLKFEDFEIINYKCHDAIKAEMAV